MQYKELIEKLEENIGEVYYPIIGRIWKLYDHQFIINCSLKMKKMKYRNPKDKTVYLAGLCKKLHKGTVSYNTDDFKL